MALWVKCLALDVSSGLDLRVVSSSPTLGSMLGMETTFRKGEKRGIWVAQWVKASAFGSGHDPRVLRLSPESGSLLSREPVSLSLCLCLPLCLLVASVCQINK